MLRLASTRMSEEVTRHKVIQSDDIPVDNRLASIAAAALISETSHFLKKKKKEKKRKEKKRRDRELHYSVVGNFNLSTKRCQNYLQMI